MKQHKVISIIVIIQLLGLFTFANNVFALGSPFTIGATVINDTTPPSVPTGILTNSVSTGEIDLTWATSTDNAGIAGYVVRRDGVAIATTTSTSYNDTGLNAATSYSYTIESFDLSGNYSGQSASAVETTQASSGGGDTTPPSVNTFLPLNAATGVATGTLLQITFSEPVNKLAGNIQLRKYSDDSLVETISVATALVTVASTLVTIGHTQPLQQNTQYYIEIPAGAFVDQSSNAFLGFSGNTTWSFTTFDNVAPSITGVTASTTYTTAGVAFDTNESALATFSWGTTTDYGNGSGSELGYYLSHYFSLSGLSTSTTYYYRIVARDPSNNQSTYTGTFTTQTPPPPPDTTPPANVTNLTATPARTTVALTWTNPTDSDFQLVRVMRKQGGYPTDQNDGTPVYVGGSTSATDSGLSTSTTYYYAVFARDFTGNYSSGAIASATTLPDPPPPPTVGQEDQPPVPVSTSTPPSPTPTTTPIRPPDIPISTTTGPFVTFPATGTPNTKIADLTLQDFIFSQTGKKDQTPDEVGIVEVSGENPFTVSVRYARLPEVLKTITFTLYDPNDPNKRSSYLLRISSDKLRYEATIAKVGQEDKYPYEISVLDHDAQGLKRLQGILSVSLTPKPTVLPAPVQQIVDDTIQSIQQPVSNVAPVAVPVGVAVGVSQVAIVTSNISSFYDLYLLLLKMLGLLTGVFRKKRKEPWGVVYDSVTKRPLDPAYVIAKLRGAGQSTGEAITDLDGRYGFLLNPGEYIIEANKTHYKFPSEKLKGKARDEFYENLYFGDPFQVREGSVVQYNIPLDPIEFDWNEYAKNQDKVFKIYSRGAKIRHFIFAVVFYAGFAMSLVTLAIDPSKINVAVVSIYAVILAIQVVWRATHRITRVLSKETGKPIPFALIKVWLDGLNTVIKKAVADEQGRFYFLVPPGKYYVTVEQKMPDGTYKEVLHTDTQELTGGVVKTDLLI